MSELKVHNRQAAEELAKAKDERDATADILAKLEMLVTERRDRDARS